MEIILKKTFSVSDNSETLNNEMFASKVHQVSQLLLNSTKNSDYVLCLYERSVYNIICPFAIWNSGYVYLPVDNEITDSKLNDIINFANPGCILTDNLNIHRFEKFSKRTNILNLQKIKWDFRNINLINLKSNLFYLIFTSGTTGNPKGVLIKKNSLLKRVNWQINKLFHNCNDIFIQKTTISFDVSLWEIFIPVFISCKVFVPDKVTSVHSKRLNNYIINNEISVIHFVPTLFNNFLSSLEGIPPSLKNIICSGEELTLSMFVKFKSLVKGLDLNVLLWNFYGPTETTIDVFYHKIDFNRNYDKIPIGTPIDFTNYIVVDELNNQCIQGELLICGDLLSVGYLNNSKQNELSFVNLDKKIYYKTGDIVNIHNNEVFYQSRKDNQIKINGVRIELSEIEEILINHLKCNCVVFLFKKTIDNSFLIAFVESTNTVDFSSIYQNLSDYLKKDHIPKYFINLEKFPLLLNGKINKSKLIDIASNELK